MSRYINADKLIDFIDCGHLRSPTEVCFSELDVVRMIKKMLTADVKPVVYGKWIWDDFLWRCSICGVMQDYRYNFCPHCGTDMRKECEQK